MFQNTRRKFMNSEKQIALIEEMDEGMMRIIISKRADYGTEDVLSNFKRLSEASKAINLNVNTPIGYALFMVLMKIDRINNLLTNGKIPNNEGISDSFDDGINYFKLAACLFEENE